MVQGIEMKGKTLWVFLVLLAVYACFFPRWAEWNQNSRMDLTMAIVEQGTFAIDDYYENTGDYAVYGDHVYTDKAPGTSFVAVPVYLIFRAVARFPIVERALWRLSHSQALQTTLREEGTGLLKEKVTFAAALYFVTFFSVALPSALLGGLLYAFLGYVLPSTRLRFLLVVAYGLGTIAFPYSTVFYGHQLAAALLFLAFVVAWQVRRGLLGRGALVGVGALLGLTVLVELPALVAVALLAFYALGAERRLWADSLVRMGFPALAFALLLGFYNASCFGSPLRSSYQYLANFPEISAYGILGFGLPRLEALWGVTLSPYRGLFFLSPFLLVALPGFVAWGAQREWRAEALLVGSTVALHVLLISCWYDWRGGFSIGPRNLLLILPYLVVAVAFFLRRWGRLAWVRVIFVFLVGLSLFLIGVATTATQAFPSITIANPWFQYWWPAFVAGDVARNLGMALGLQGLWSLLPLLALVGSASAWFLVRARRAGS